MTFWVSTDNKTRGWIFAAFSAGLSRGSTVRFNWLSAGCGLWRQTGQIYLRTPRGASWASLWELFLINTDQISTLRGSQSLLMNDFMSRCPHPCSQCPQWATAIPCLLNIYSLFQFYSCSTTGSSSGGDVAAMRDEVWQPQWRKRCINDTSARLDWGRTPTERTPSAGANYTQQE